MPGKNRSTYESSTFFASARSKTGDLLEFRYEIDVESENRGFIANEMSAWNANQKVGYLLVTYVPKDSFERYNPTIWHFATNFGGLYYLDVKDQRNPFDYNDAEFDVFTNRYRSHIHWNADHVKTDRSEFKKMLETSQRFGKLKEDQRQFVAFHVDRPYVGYINAGEASCNGCLSDHRGEGVGFLLYLMTARRLAQDGLELHSSSLQQEEPARIWSRFAASGWAVDDGQKRMMLVKDAIPTLEDLSEFLGEKRPIP